MRVVPYDSVRIIPQTILTEFFKVSKIEDRSELLFGDAARRLSVERPALEARENGLILACRAAGTYAS